MVLKVYKVKISCGKHNVSNIKKGGTIIFAIRLVIIARKMAYLA
jgi:hypothetical protein